MSRPAKRSSTPISPRGGDAALPATNTEAPKKRETKTKKKKEPVNLSDDDIYFIVEESYQRKQRKWTQEEVADKAGVVRTTIQFIEAWQRGLSLRVAASIARAYSSSIDYFIEAGRAKKILPEFKAFFPEMPK